MPAPPFLTSTTSLSNWNGKQPALPFKSAPAVSDNTQSYTSNKKAEKMHHQSVRTAAAETVFAQFNLFNPNQVRKVKGIQIKQKSNWTATSGSKAFFVRHCWREIQGVSGLSLRPHLKPTAWEHQQTSTILLTRPFLELGGNPIPGFPGRADVLAWLENERSCRQVRCISALPIKQGLGKGSDCAFSVSFFFFFS